MIQFFPTFEMSQGLSSVRLDIWGWSPKWVRESPQGVDLWARWTCTSCSVWRSPRGWTLPVTCGPTMAKWDKTQNYSFIMVWEPLYSVITNSDARFCIDILVSSLYFLIPPLVWYVCVMWDHGMYLGISQLEHEVTSYPAVWAVSKIQTTIIMCIKISIKWR